MPQSYLFFLGSTVELCQLELKTIANRLNWSEPLFIKPNIALLEFNSTPTNTDLQKWQNLLGGTVKIASILEQQSLQQHNDVSSVQQQIVDLLLSSKPKRFAVSEVGRDHLPPVDVAEVKNILRDHNLKSSYLESSRHGVSAAQFKQTMTEITVIQTDSSLLYAKTETMQDIDSWTHRDIDKPNRDTKKGMLQPKVARMMVNIALGDAAPEESIILDPFVGTGTILIEATDLGVPVVLGADYSPDQVIAATHNLEWWQKHDYLNFSYEIVCKDVSNLQPGDFSSTPTTIVTEPFLGKLRPTEEKIEGITRGLSKLYKGVIKTFTELLAPGSQVAIILPSWQIRGKKLVMKQTLTHFQKAGFELLYEPVRAGRVGSFTQREVHVLKYNPYVES